MVKEKYSQALPLMKLFFYSFGYQVGIIILLLCFFNYFNYPLTWLKLKDALDNWDGSIYLQISQLGYQTEKFLAPAIVFFPFYPLLIALGSSIASPYVFGLLISSLSAILGRIFFYKFLISLKINKVAIHRSMALLLLSPITLYFILLYTEGIFFFLTTLFLYHLYKGKYKQAVFFGLLASATRSMGVLILVPFYLRLWEKKALNLKNCLTGGVILLGLGIYLGINYKVFGDIFYFREPMKEIWQKDLVNPLTQYYYNLIHFEFNPNQITYSLDLLLTLLFLPLYLLGMSFSKLPLSLHIWSLSQWLFVSSQSFWLSNTRYLGLILPVYIILGEISSKYNFLYIIILALSGSLMLYTYYLFAHHAWIF